MFLMTSGFPCRSDLWEHTQLSYSILSYSIVKQRIGLRLFRMFRFSPDHPSPGNMEHCAHQPSSSPQNAQLPLSTYDLTYVPYIHTLWSAIVSTHRPDKIFPMPDASTSRTVSAIFPLKKKRPASDLRTGNCCKFDSVLQRNSDKLLLYFPASYFSFCIQV